MAATKNNAANVSVGKGVSGGYMFVAPAGTALPTDYTTELSAEFLNMGYIGEDGVSFANSSSAESQVDMNGDTVDTSASEIEKTFTAKLLEIKKDTRALVVGSDNVTDENGVLTVHDKGPSEEEHVVVFELLLKNGRRWRRVGERVKLGELGDMAINYTELVGEEVTMTVLKGTESGDYWTDYIQSTETEPADAEDEDGGME